MEIKGDQNGAQGGWLGTIERAFKRDFPTVGGNLKAIPVLHGSMEIKGDQEGALEGWLGTIERGV